VIIITNYRDNTDVPSQWLT